MLRATSARAVVVLACEHGALAHGFTGVWYSPKRLAVMAGAVTQRAQSIRRTHRFRVPPSPQSDKAERASQTRSALIAVQRIRGDAADARLAPAGGHRSPLQA
jgi:hypothetical protein